MITEGADNLMPVAEVEDRPTEMPSKELQMLGMEEVPLCILDVDE